MIWGRAAVALDYRQRGPWLALPDDDNYAVEYVVRVPDVSEQAEGEQHETHLQDEHAGENDVADLQDVSQLLGLGQEDTGERVNISTCTLIESKHTSSCCRLLIKADLPSHKAKSQENAAH